jgi:hypothetical protein
VAHVSLTAGAREPRFGTNARRPLAPVHPAAAGISSGTAPNRRASKITAAGSDLSTLPQRGCERVQTGAAWPSFLAAASHVGCLTSSGHSAWSARRSSSRSLAPSLRAVQRAVRTARASACRAQFLTIAHNIPPPPETSRAGQSILTYRYVPDTKRPEVVARGAGSVTWEISQGPSSTVRCRGKPG